jgi:hypothetical protein
MDDKSATGWSKVAKVRAAQVVAAVGAYLLTRWAFFAILWPVVFGLTAFLLLRRWGRADRAFLAPVLAIQAGEIGWEILGVLFLGTYQPVVVDAVLASLGMQWLYNRPTLRAVYVLLTFFLIQVGYKAYQLVQLPVDRSVAGITGSLSLSTEQLSKGLVVHLVLQVLTLALLMRLGKRLSDSNSSVEANPSSLHTTGEPKRLI